jgi:hypothetical protein
VMPCMHRRNGLCNLNSPGLLTPIARRYSVAANCVLAMGITRGLKYLYALARADGEIPAFNFMLVAQYGPSRVFSSGAFRKRWDGGAGCFPRCHAACPRSGQRGPGRHLNHPAHPPRFIAGNRNSRRGKEDAGRRGAANAISESTFQWYCCRWAIKACM